MVVLINTIENAKMQSICADHGNHPGALIEILHAVQAEEGFLSDASLRDIADILNISHAEIHGVVSFYHDFHRQPVAKTIIKICRAEACQAVGGESLARHAEQHYGSIDSGEIGVKAVYCLGNCALGPAAMIDDQLYGRVTPERLDALALAHAEKPETSQ